jgi:hypothetical protein
MEGRSQHPHTIAQIARLEAALESMIKRIDNAHTRMDRIETQLGSDLKDIRSGVQELRDFMNKSKGGVATLLVAGGIAGGIVAELGRWIIGKVP